jgi:hypothetical protein
MPRAPRKRYCLSRCQPCSASRRNRRLIDVAARQGDAHGDDRQAIVALTAGITRHEQDAPAALLVEALLYRAELRARTGERPQDDVAAAALLITQHDLGPEAEASLQRAREVSGLD